MNAKLEYTRGFTLLEVLIALVVLGVGMAALLQVQSSFLKGASDSEVSSTAHILAERKLEELRNFDSISGFNSIVSGASQDVSVSHGSGSYFFSWSWDVTAYTSSGLTTVSDAETAYKEVTVRVAPKDGSGSEISLSSIIARIDPSSEPDLGSDGVGGGKPTVNYTAGQAPDVIAIKLDENGDKLRETSKPLPEIEQQGQNYASTVVNFETVTFDSSSRLVTEDFVTVNCLCEFINGGLGQGLEPAVSKLNDSGDLETVYPLPLDTVSKAVGQVAETGQSFLCDRCCRDHHDSNSSENKYRWYWPDSAFLSVASSSLEMAGDHAHFSSITPSSETWVDPTTGGEYVENCRFKRVDGIYRLMQDWKMLDITVMPSSYLASGAVGNDLYKNYVTSVAQSVMEQASNASNSVGYDFALIAASVSKSSLTNRNMVSGAEGALEVGDRRQVLSRAIFIDPLTSSAWANIGADYAASTAVQNWLPQIPLYEVNTTLLSEWGEDSSGAQLAVYNEPVVTIVDPDNDYYGTYRRGLVVGVSSGSSISLTASSAISNTGLVGHRATSNNLLIWTDSFFDGANQLNDSILVDVIDTVSKYIISGDIDCTYATTNNGGQTQIKGCGSGQALAVAADGGSVDMQLSAIGGTCTFDKQSDRSYSYSCEFPDGTEKPSLFTFSSSTGYKFYLSDYNLAETPFSVTDADTSDLVGPSVRVLAP